MGDHGLGRRNDRGDRMLQFCQENDIIISNTFYELPKRRMYTWKSPQHNSQNTVRNQINHILANQSYRNSIRSVKAYPGADAFSDHNPLIARVHIKLKKPSQKIKIDQIDTSLLQDPKIKEDLKRQFNDNFRLLSTKTQNTNSVEDKWKDLKGAITKPAQSLLTRGKQKRGQEWITERILGLMEEQRQCKTECKQRYKEIHKQIRNEIRTAKETFYERKCEEIEELQLKHDIFNLHKKI